MVNSTTNQWEEPFHTALDELERCAETPFVPGELERWHSALFEGLRHFTPHLKQHTREMHPAEFQNIEDEDPELTRRVELMRAEDRELEQEADRLIDDAARLEAAVHKAEPDEARVEAPLTRLANATLGFVIRVRKQEIAVRTWLGEAFGRDRGTID